MYILASDYDGTLNLNGTVSDKDKKYIKKWRKAGNLFGIVTGRGFSGINYEVKSNDLVCDFCICHNGSVIYDGSDKPTAMFTADGKVLLSLVPFLIKSGGLTVGIYNADESYCVKIDNGHKCDPEKNWIDIEDLKTITAFDQLETIFENDESAAEITAEVNRTYGEFVTAYQNGGWINIVPAGVGKDTGLLRYIELKKVPKENTFAVGDNYNDLGMIKEFNGFTVKSGKPEVIAQARMAYDSIAGLIEEYI